MTWAFGNLQMFKYGVIYADPATRFENYSAKGEGKSPQAHYKCMTDEELMALPVGQLASKDCLLFMWATWPKLDVSMRMLEAWGFKYKTGGAWRKETKHGKVAFGNGYILRSACEPYLIGTIGKPEITSKSVRGWQGEEDPITAFEFMLNGERREYSRKPDHVYDVINQLCAKPFKAELFARTTYPSDDWEVWGDEVGKFQIEETV